MNKKLSLDVIIDGSLADMFVNGPRSYLVNELNVFLGEFFKERDRRKGRSGVFKIKVEWFLRNDTKALRRGIKRQPAKVRD